MIRNATLDDLPIILEIYKYAREFMKNNGNPTQWKNNFPPEELLINDIKKKQLFVYENNGVINGVFAFIIGEDATYKYIEGNWLSDDIYGTIHRVASDGSEKGLLNKIVDFCSKNISHIRIDTHEDNKVMQHVIEKNGFTKCGIIYVADGSPRIAYEKI